MKKRIYRSTVIIVLAALLAFSLILSFGLYFSFSNAYQQQLSTQLNLLSTAIEDAEDPETVFDQWRGNTGDSRLTLIDDAGNVICDTEADADEMENHLDRPEVAEALETGFGISRRQSTTVREMTFYAAQLLSNGNILRISMSQRSIYSVLADTLIFCLLAIPLTMIASSILAGRTTKSILKPIDNLDLDHPADNEIYDEFAPLMSCLVAQNRRIDSQIL